MALDDETYVPHSPCIFTQNAAHIPPECALAFSQSRPASTPLKNEPSVGPNPAVAGGWLHEYNGVLNLALRTVDTSAD